MKKILFALLCNILACSAYCQTTELAPGNYKVINIGNNGKGDFTKSVILLHEIYDSNEGTKLGKNFAIGEITGMRGSAGSNNRTNVAYVNTSSAYTQTYASVNCVNGDGKWILKTLFYNNKKYLAVDVPFRNDYLDLGFRFAGWTQSSGENMKIIAYERSGSFIEDCGITEMQDYTSNMSEYHDVSKFIIQGNVGIGTNTPDAKLAVNGDIHAQEVNVNVDGWSDFVFDEDYKLRSIEEVEQFVTENNHLPDIPDETTVKSEGVNVGEMNAKLLQKIEELTIYIIQQNKKIESQNDIISALSNRIDLLEKSKEEPKKPAK